MFGSKLVTSRTDLMKSLLNCQVSYMDLFVRRVIHFALYPFLVGFLLDLPWRTQTLISLILVLAAFSVGNFVTALLALWQATAVAGLLALILDYSGASGLNPLYAAISIPLVWLLLLFVARRRRDRNEESPSRSLVMDISGVLTLVYLYFIVPRGRLENFGFLYAEDNERWLTSVIDSLRGDSLEIVSSFDSFSVQYFTKFFLNGFLILGGASTESISHPGISALVVLSNAWVLVLLSVVLFTLRISFRFIRVTSSQNGIYIFAISGSVFSILFFRASQSVGHFPQFLLSGVVFVFMCTISEISNEDSLTNKVFSLIIAGSVACAMVGSYNPWLPITIFAMVILLNSSFTPSLMRRMFSRNFGFLLIISVSIGAFLAFRFLSKYYDGLDIGGGVWSIPLEGVWFVWILVVLILSLSIKQRVMKKFGKEDRQDVSEQNSTLHRYSSLASLVLVISLLLRLNGNELAVIGLVLLFGLVFSKSPLEHMFVGYKKIVKSDGLDGVILLSVASFGYATVIWLMSRFIGPIYAPMYAANKSMLAAFSQFFWIPLIMFYLTENSVERFKQFIRGLTIAIGFLLIVGVAPFLDYREVQKQWWHRDVIGALEAQPGAIVVCVNPDWRMPDYSVYTCNRFTTTLGPVESPAGLFRYVAWYQPNNEYETVVNYFKTHSIDRRVIVISNGVITGETKAIFKPVAAENISFLDSSG